jgi:hypothetical protein
MAIGLGEIAQKKVCAGQAWVGQAMVGLLTGSACVGQACVKLATAVGFRAFFLFLFFLVSHFFFFFYTSVACVARIGAPDGGFFNTTA